MLNAASPSEVEALTANGDFLVMDYRGVENSVPRLDCPNALAPTAQQQIEALTMCYQSYGDEGLDLSTYDSHDIADDVDDLRRSLGLDQMNLLGVSYGTRIALEVMRRHADGVRAVVLNSPVPPQSLWWAEQANNMEAAYLGLFGACAADSACSSQYGDLATEFPQTVATLNQAPLLVSATGMTVTVNGTTLIEALGLALHSRDYYAVVPKVIAAAAHRDAAVLSAAVGQVVEVRIPASEGMNQAVWCNDTLQYVGMAAIAQAEAGADVDVQQYFRQTVIDGALGACSAMKRKSPDALDVEPVSSTIPTFILTGEYDPVTPPRYGAAIAATLSRATSVTLPKSGHGTWNTTCGLALVDAFLADPGAPLDTSCAAALENLTFE
jgi:pimeloyl-ACP methyl ester carboxylesterase